MNNKEIYEPVDLSIIVFESNDIITDSMPIEDP